MQFASHAPPQYSENKSVNTFYFFLRILHFLNHLFNLFVTPSRVFVLHKSFFNLLKPKSSSFSILYGKNIKPHVALDKCNTYKYFFVFSIKTYALGTH